MSDVPAWVARLLEQWKASAAFHETSNSQYAQGIDRCVADLVAACPPHQVDMHCPTHGDPLVCLACEAEEEAHPAWAPPVHRVTPPRLRGEPPPQEALSEAEYQEAETLAHIVAHWFIQGGESQFGPLDHPHNGDELISQILSRVRSSVAASPPPGEARPRQRDET
jgi:hypothetical protein